MTPKDSTYSLIVVGTGFASTFFLWEYLKHADKGAWILVLERGRRIEHREQVDRGFQAIFEDPARTFINRNPEKSWIFGVLFGGGSNYWTGNTPRQLPTDFELQSRYGVGTDWPLSYNELEEHYCEAEDLMAVAGPPDSPVPRSRPYPQGPHQLNDPDLLLKKAFPDEFFVLPTARPTRATDRRARCCANSICNLCPVNAKFTILNSEIGDVYKDPRVTLEIDARVDTVDVESNLARGVTYREGETSHTVRGETVVLGANALFNPHILQRSGFEHPRLGTGLCEQVGIMYDVHLDGLKSFQGSTIQTGHGYMVYDGAHRKKRAAALIETQNAPFLRMERGKWRQRYMIKFIFEDLPRNGNYVRPSAGDPDKPETVYQSHSEYTQRGIDAIPGELDRILAGWPVESVRELRIPISSEAHIQCTTPMGRDPATSIVDRGLVHHRARNLLVLGSSVFPTCPPANPTLTLSALSLWAARRLMSSRSA